MSFLNKGTAACRLACFLGLIVISALACLSLSVLGAGRFRTLLMRRIQRILCYVCGIQVTFDTLGRRSDARGPDLVVANHLTYLDIVVVGSLLPTVFLAKREVGDWPLLGACGRALGCMFVDRFALPDRVRALLTMRRGLSRGRQSICVFPEGTTTKQRTPDRTAWRRGQMWAVTPGTNRILCLGIAYEDQNTLAWIDDDEFLPHLWEVLQRPCTRVHVVGRELIPPRDAQTNVSSLSARAFDEVSALCELAHARLEGILEHRADPFEENPSGGGVPHHAYSANTSQPVL